jgi:transcription elongation factor Elf1
MILGRKRKKVVKYTRSQLPTKYLCPNCGKNTIGVIVHEEDEIARMICSNCSLKEQIKITRDTAPIDAYCQFVDEFYGVQEQDEE